MNYTVSRLRSFSFTLSVGLLLSAFAGAGAQVNDAEQRLVRVLESNSSLQEKDAACAQLKRIGSPASVPALARLLTDTNLSHSARYALESMPGTETSRALIDALPRTSGMLKVGLIDSLAQRRQKSAVKPLAAAMKSSDSHVASAAAAALGRIGGAEAMDDLLSAIKSSKEPLRGAAVQAGLNCADQLRVEGENRRANRAFEQIYAQAQDEGIKVAAYRGIILSSGKSAVAVAAAAIAKSSDARQVAALQLVHELMDPQATKAFSDLLSHTEPAVQAPLIAGLGQRNDPAAVPAIVEQLNNQALDIRLAALRALGTLGGPSQVGVLIRIAAKTGGAEQLAARQALDDLPGIGVKEALFQELASEDPKIQAEAALSLGERREIGSIPSLLKLAQTGKESARNSALLALSSLATEKDLDSMVRLVTDSRSPADCAKAAEALNTVYQRLRLRNPDVDARPLISAARNGSTDVRIALLPVCSGLSDPESAKVLIEAAHDSNPAVRAAGVRALSDTANPELLTVLARLTQELPEDNLKSIAIAGFVRLATDEASMNVPLATKLNGFDTILSSTLRPEQIRMVLAGLGQIPDTRAIKLAEPFLENEGVKTEAARALLKTAPVIADTDTATGALRHVLVAQGIDAETRKAAQSALDVLAARADYLVAWEVSGPYRKAGVDYAGLFDMVFAPEQEASETAKWALVQTANDPAKPGVVDLLKAFGGEQCVAYARSWVFSPKQQEAKLEMGSDDGLKVWVNGTMVHANNVARPLQPGSDKTHVTLKEGWNRLMIKVTQNNLGWEFCLRFLNPDGSRLAGLRAAVEKP